jgi:hypothetical protein
MILQKKIEGRDVKTINFKRNLTPYISIGESQATSLPIKYIIVGPGSNKKSRCEKLKKYLELCGHSFDVKISDTPLI